MTAPGIKGGGNVWSGTNRLGHVVERWTRILLALLALANQLCAVKINDITVPSSIKNGTNEILVLDCDFDVSANDENVVIKWFLNDDPQPIYQWIPNLLKQSTSEKYQDYIIVETQTSASSQNDKKYRTLKIKRPTTELTGTYRCEVLSLDSQDSKASVMVVYAHPEKLKFFASEGGLMEGVNLTCEAEGVFPLPQLRVYKIPAGGSQKIQLPGKKTLNNQSGVYDIKLNVQLDTLDEAKGPMYFECELQINNTDFKLYERLVYIPPADGSSNESKEPECTPPECGCAAITSSIAICLVTVFISTRSWFL